MRRALTEGIRAGVRRLFVPAIAAPRRSREDLKAELQAHVDARVEYLIARGRTVAEARAEAERRFGNLDDALVLLEDSAVERDRRLSSRERLASLRQGARFVVRGLGRNSAFTAGVVTTLTLG